MYQPCGDIGGTKEFDETKDSSKVLAILFPKCL